MRPLLLDVNVLVALFDSQHAHYNAAQNWFRTAQERGWRTCPLTEGGMVRVLSNPRVRGWAASAVAKELEDSKRRVSGYEFWADDESVTEWVSKISFAIPSSKMTDAHLLKLAVRKGGTLATFDVGVNSALIGINDRDLVMKVPL